MLKVAAGILVGMVAAAAVVEIVSRRNPRVVKDVEGRMRRTARRAVDAFKEGYARPRRSPTTSASTPS